MSENKTIRLTSKTSSKERTLLSAGDVLRHAEALIRFEGEAAIHAQQGVSDLAAVSQDQRFGTPPNPSSLKELCGTSGGVKIKSDKQNQNKSKQEADPPNVVSFSSRKKD